MSIELCPHRANPRACPTCWREGGAKQAPPLTAKPAATPGNVVAFNEASMHQNIAKARANAAAQANGKQAPTGPLPQPYVEAEHDPAAHDPNRLWQPKAHKSVTDRVKPHPNVDKSNMTVLNAAPIAPYVPPQPK